MASILPTSGSKRVSSRRDQSALDAFCERAILGLVLAILVYGPLATGAVRVPDFLVIQTLAMGVLALWAVRFWTSRPFRLFWPPICWPVAAFVVYAVARCQTADLAYPARQELIQIIVYAALFFAIINNLNRRESGVIVTVTLTVLALGLSIFGIFQFAAHYPKIWGFIKPASYVSRASGTYINPDHFAGFLEMVLPVALAYAIIGRLSHVSRLLLGYCVLVLLCAIGLSISRGAILSIGIVLGIFVLFMLLRRDFWIKAVIVLVLAGTVGGVLWTRTESLSRRFEMAIYQGKLNDGRVLYWDAAAKVFLDHPVLGAGPLGYKEQMIRYRHPLLQLNPEYVHNDYLQTLCEWGMVGLALIAAVCGLLFWGAVKTWPFVCREAHANGSKRSNKSALVLGGSLGVFAILLHSVVDFNMHIPANAILAVSLMALVTAQWRFATERFWVNPGQFGKLLLSLIAALGLGYLSLQLSQNLKEHIYLHRVTLEKGQTTAKEAALKAAFEVQPDNYETALALGELYRRRSWEGNADYREQAIEAMAWFARVMDINPYDSVSRVRYGMCLDWLGRTGESSPYYMRALKLDPNNCWVITCIGWHALQIEDYEAAKAWFHRSLEVTYTPTAVEYLDLVNRREAAAGKN